MPCQLFAQKCSKLSRNNKNIIVRGPPEHSAIGTKHRGILLMGIITLQHVIQKQLPVGLTVLSNGMVYFLKIEKNFNKSTKTILWL